MAARQTRWEVVATVSEPLPLLMAFVAHHIGRGAERVSLYLDDADQDVASALSSAPGCNVVLCNDKYWSARRPEGRPSDHRQRQVINANDALERCEFDWLVHLDADEFLIGAEVAAELGAIDPAVDVVAVRVRERVFVRGANDHDVFQGVERGGRPGARRIGQFLFPKAGDFMRNGMVGHSVGKSFVRVGRGHRMHIHTVEASVGAKMLRNLYLLHFDGLTQAHWIDKLYSKSVTSSEIPEHRRADSRRKLIEYAMGDGIYRDHMDRTFSWVMQVSPLVAAVGQATGLMKRIRLPISSDIEKVYPGVNVDLSPAGFDRELSKKTRRVPYRGGVFHVNLLENFTERLIAIKGKTREEAEITWLVERLKGEKIAFFDVGANIGLYSVSLGMHLDQNSTIVPVECNPVLLPRLKKNLASNGLKNALVCEMALSDVSKIAHLNIVSPGNLGEATLNEADVSKGAGRVEVKAIPLLECMDLYSVDQIDFLKLDIEGHEHRVMNAFFDAADPTRYPRMVLMEMKHADGRLDDLHGRMMAEGYGLAFEAKNNRIYAL